MKQRIPLIASLFFSVSAMAQLQMPEVFSSHMVLQQNQPNKIWGWSETGKTVHLQMGTYKQTVVAGKNGAFEMSLPALKGGTHTTIQLRAGDQSVTYDDVVAGEVWFCSGQSNMEWRLGWLGDTYAEEMAAPADPSIRFMVVGQKMASNPIQDVTLVNSWEQAGPLNRKNCSAVAYWYAKQLQQTLNVPVGLIVSAWGGTPVEPWIGPAGYKGLPRFEKFIKNVLPGINYEHLEDQGEQYRQKFDLVMKEKYAGIHEMIQTEYQDENWINMNLPGQWENQGYPIFDGVAVLRLRFEVSAAQEGKAAVLQMPAIDDQDSTWVNGVFVGNTQQWDAPRTYQIPAGVLKKGINVLAIRVLDTGGGGGLADNPGQFVLHIGSTDIPLSGKARLNLIAKLMDATGGYGPPQFQPTVLFHGMVEPLIRYGIRGAIWYQGESNAGMAKEYQTLFPALIKNWRQAFRIPDMPFYFVQLSSFGTVQQVPVESNWARLREAQTMTLRLPMTGMAVSTDIGDPQNIHPTNKKTVGERLANQALLQTYRKLQGTVTGPLYMSSSVSGSVIRIRFRNTGKGLIAHDGPLAHFAIAGSDRKFYWAQATIHGNEVWVQAPEVPRPVAVRYAWSDSPVTANLFNQEGYPASGFRTDNW